MSLNVAPLIFDDVKRLRDWLDNMTISASLTERQNKANLMHQALNRIENNTRDLERKAFITIPIPRFLGSKNRQKKEEKGCC